MRLTSTGHRQRACAVFPNIPLTTTNDEKGILTRVATHLHPPHLPILHGGGAAVLYPATHHADGARFAGRHAGGSGRSGQQRDHSLAGFESRCLSKHAHRGALCLARGSHPRHAPRRNLRLLLCSRGNDAQTAATGDAHGVVLHQQRLSHGGFPALQGHAHHE